MAKIKDAMLKDYYEILRIPRDASAEDIKRAYHVLAHQFHPNKVNGDETGFKEISEAYQILSNDENRLQYDQELSDSQSSRLSKDDLFVEDELKRGIFKFQNDDYVEAEKIFQNLVTTDNNTLAWAYLGLIKLEQLDSGKTDVQQALNCFVAATDEDPDMKEQYQGLYSAASIKQIDKFSDYFSEMEKKASKKSSRAIGSLALGGLSFLFGSQAKKNNNDFGSVVGNVGGVYGTYRSLENHQQSEKAKQFLLFYADTIKQLIAGVGSYCSDNKAVYQEFFNNIEELGLSG